MSNSSIPSHSPVDIIASGTDKPGSGPRRATSRPITGEGHATSERRALDEPAKQLKRRLFDEIAARIHRYSHDPLAKNEQGEYITSDEKIRQFLAQEIEELRKLDPLIPLLHELEEKYQDKPVEPDRLQVVSYKIVNPSIKALNDIYLGPNQTDDYTADLHKAIDKELSAHQAKLLNTYFKGGVFFVDHGPSNGHTPKEHAAMMQAHEARIKEVAKTILIHHLEKRHDDLFERVADNSLTAIGHNQRQLKELIARLEAGEEKIEIAFGFESVAVTNNPMDALTSILNAEREANMVSLEHKKTKKNGNPPEEKEARKYTHETLLTELISATIELYQHVLDQNGQLKPEWSKFFKQNENDIVVMRRSMIQKFRKIELYRESDEYCRMTEEARMSFEAKLKVFAEYYEQINVVDVLKKTTFENLPAYLARIRGIVKFIDEAEQLLEDGSADSESLRLALLRSSDELEVSLKDEGYKTVHTARASIKALMAGDESILVFGDNIGFAGLNQSSYENSVLNLIDTLGLTGEEIQAVMTTVSADNDNNPAPLRINKQALRELLQRKLAVVGESPVFKQTLLSVGDDGTNYLRANQKRLSQVFNGKAKASADGGDEDNITYTKANGCNIPEDPLEIERALFRISEEAKIRIAVVYGDMKFTPMPEYDEKEGVTQQTRFEIVRLMKALQFAEFAHRKIKAQGRTIIETKPADKIMTQSGKVAK